MNKPAHAQNLVQDPNFLSGLQYYTATGGTSIITLSSQSNAAFFSNPGDSITQAIATTPGAVYVVTFLAAFDPFVADTAVASFGDGSLPFSFASGAASGNEAQYTFTGIATGSLTDLTFANTGGESYISGLDVEGAPAPIVGGGGASFLAGLALLIGARLRNRRTA